VIRSHVVNFRRERWQKPVVALVSGTLGLDSRLWMIADVAKELIGQFAQNLGREIQRSSPAVIASTLPSDTVERRGRWAKPINGLRLAVRVIVASVERGFNRLVAKG
jgi:hypothetical protein